MCLAFFLHYLGKWHPRAGTSRYSQQQNVFSARCQLCVSAYFMFRSFVIVLIAYSWLSMKDVQGDVESHYAQSGVCEHCYDQAELNPKTYYEFSYCQRLLGGNSSYEKLPNLLPGAHPNSILTEHASDVKYLDDMNVAQISIWAIVFGLGFVTTMVEYVWGWSLPRMMGLTVLHRNRYHYLRQAGERITLENMCAFGMSEDLVRQGAYHFRSIASVFTIPITLAAFNEHYRWTLANDGCYTDIRYPNQEAINSLYYIESLGVYLLLYVSALLVILLVVCYCCRKHLYQLLRICFLIFFFTIFTVNFLAIFFLFANVRYVADRTDSIQVIFAFVCLLTLLEVEFTVLSPCLCIVHNHRRHMRSLNRYQTEGRNLNPKQAAECRMVAFLRGLYLPSHTRALPKRHQQARRRGMLGLLRSDYGGGHGVGDGGDIENACGATEMKTVIVGNGLVEAPAGADPDAAGDWTRPLQAVAMHPLFDPSVFKTVHAFQSPSRAAGVGDGENGGADDDVDVDRTACLVSVEDYLMYRFWMSTSPKERAKVRHVRASIKRRRRLSSASAPEWDEKERRQDVTPVLL